MKARIDNFEFIVISFRGEIPNQFSGKSNRKHGRIGSVADTEKFISHIIGEVKAARTSKRKAKPFLHGFGHQHREIDAGGISRSRVLLAKIYKYDRGI
jgi:hypothetical protein